MTWQEKFAAINKLGEASLKMNRDGEWYVDQPSVETHYNGMKFVSQSRLAATPQSAVERYWQCLTVAMPREQVVVRVVEHWQPVEWQDGEWKKVEA